VTGFAIKGHCYLSRQYVENLHVQAIELMLLQDRIINRTLLISVLEIKSIGDK
jgi:hypothetical protein